MNKHGDIVSGHANQGVMFEDMELTDENMDKVSVAMLMDAINNSMHSFLRTTMTLYNKKARTAEGGQLDLFSSAPQTRQEILNEVTDYIKNKLKNGERKELEAEQQAAVEQRKEQSIQQDGSTTPSSERSGEGEQGDILATSEEGVREIYKELGLSNAEELIGKMALFEHFFSP